MSYNLKWDLSGPSIFSVGRIDVDSNRSSPSMSSLAVNERTPYYSMGMPEMISISLRDCMTINMSTLENLHSYGNIPFPPFYLVEYSDKSAIRVGDHSSPSSVWLLDYNITTAARTVGIFNLKLVTSIPLQCIVCPDLKIDNMEIKVAVAEKIPSRQIVICKK